MTTISVKTRLAWYGTTVFLGSAHCWCWKKPRDGLKRQWLRINEPLSNSATRLEQLPIFTDDLVPVERMISSLLLTAEGL